ncbi:MAG: arginase family protein, partial [Candidatus Sericytochromatia bacterium]|nr:arginase family protein [Candidatus Sericytochromatia bacterium]
MIINKSRVIDIIGAPISLASPEKGASLGPDAIRISGLKDSLAYLGLEFVDSGNLPILEEPYPVKIFEQGTIRYLDEVFDFLSLLKDKVEESFNKGHFPLVLGGDHSMAMGSLAAAAKYYKSKNQKP